MHAAYEFRIRSVRKVVNSYASYESTNAIDDPYQCDALYESTNAIDDPYQCDSIGHE